MNSSPYDAAVVAHSILLSYFLLLIFNKIIKKGTRVQGSREKESKMKKVAGRLIFSAASVFSLNTLDPLTPEVI